jgi:hypothetical protein
MELNVEVINSLIGGGLALATEDALSGEMERRRKERNRIKRIKINKEYYQQRKAAKKTEESVAPTSSSSV